MNTFLYFAVLLKNLTNETTFYQQTLSGLLWRLKRSSWEIFDLVSSSLFHFTSLRRHVTAPWNCLIFSLFGKWSPLPLWYRLYSQQKLINLNSRAGSPHLGISVLTRRSFSNSDESPPPPPPPMKSGGRGGVMFSAKYRSTVLRKSHGWLGNFQYEGKNDWPQKKKRKNKNPCTWDWKSSLGYSLKTFLFRESTITYSKLLALQSEFCVVCCSSSDPISSGSGHC